MFIFKKEVIPVYWNNFAKYNYYFIIISEMKFLLLAFYSPLLSKMENDFEVDAILRIQNGKWRATEIKIGSGYIEEAAQKFIKT